MINNVRIQQQILTEARVVEPVESPPADCVDMASGLLNCLHHSVAVEARAGLMPDAVVLAQTHMVEWDVLHRPWHKWSAIIYNYLSLKQRGRQR